MDEILHDRATHDDAVALLGELLDEAGPYRVNAAGDRLEERVTPVVRDAVRKTIAGEAADPAADHLAAWQAAYGRVLDPVRAYSEAISAAEAAAHAASSSPTTRSTPWARCWGDQDRPAHVPHRGDRDRPRRAWRVGRALRSDSDGTRPSSAYYCRWWTLGRNTMCGQR
ncbi:hypothetical protein ACH47Z_44260 [Streptomyces sp. NPDC020192]|uniref:hypothetical protein n=1 Tax=Streptomyces sp. NPDC020192 TaxID=3365066 RepID=UPI00379D9977